MKRRVLLYGAYGYSGKLILEEALKNKMPVIISGRNEEKLSALASAYNIEYRVVSLEEANKLQDALEDIKVVIHTAGPFTNTAQPMFEACLKSATNYMDISGDHQVFEMAQSFSKQAQQNNITLLSGCGFNVAPSDCLALHMKNRLPSATSLMIAFAATEKGISRGTVKSTLENLGKGGKVRRNGVLITVPNAYKSMTIDFGPFKSLAVTIPWGDLVTAYFSTGIPNIEDYMAVSPGLLNMLRLSNSLRWLLNRQSVIKFLQARADSRNEGPNEEQRKTGRSYFVGKVSDDAGNERISHLETPQSYALTAVTACTIAQKILNDDIKTGYQTPATAYGEKLILDIDGCILKDMS